MVELVAAVGDLLGKASEIPSAVELMQTANTHSVGGMEPSAMKQMLGMGTHRPTAVKP